MNTPNTSSAAATKSVLVVEDQKAFAELWQLKLGKMGFDVSVCADGAEAIEQLNKKKFDVILLDLFMPKNNGFDVLSHKVSTINADTPTYVLTSTTKQEDIQKALQLGAKKMFLKYEVSPKDVVQTIQEEVGV